MTSDYRPNSDVRQDGLSAFQIEQTFRICGGKCDDQDTVLFRGSVCGYRNRKCRRGRDPGATARRHLDRMLRRWKRRLRHSDGRLSLCFARVSRDRSQWTLHDRNIYPGFQQQGVPGGERSLDANNRPARFFGAPKPTGRLSTMETATSSRAGSMRAAVSLSAKPSNNRSPTLHCGASAAALASFFPMRTISMQRLALVALRRNTPLRRPSTKQPRAVLRAVQSTMRSQSARPVS